MADWPFTKGLHDLGQGCWAWIQPDGGWGWSNAGLITDGDEALLFDTLFDLKLTQEMLDAMRARIPQAGNITQLVNSHANGDHTFGNELVKGAEIIASQGTVDEFDHLTPEKVQAIMDNAPNFGRAGELVKEFFHHFDFKGITLTPPTKVFSGETELRVGDKVVQLIEVGPAHTKGDTIAYLPQQKILYTADILFNGGTPISWEGPIDNWIRALDRILGMDAEIIVPGHGPVTDKSAVQALRDYFAWLSDETAKRHAAGMSADEAAYDIDPGRYAAWTDAERLVVTVQVLYDALDGRTEPREMVPYFAKMAEYRDHLRSKG